MIKDNDKFTVKVDQTYKEQHLIILRPSYIVFTAQDSIFEKARRTFVIFSSLINKYFHTDEMLGRVCIHEADHYSYQHQVQGNA